jgi:hypothetical protein
MRIPFLGGFLDRTREKTRLVVPEGETPSPIKGPWVLRAVVRGSADYVPSPPPASAEEASRSRSNASRAEPESSDSDARSTPSE